jgi:hypothetical protein
MCVKNDTPAKKSFQLLGVILIVLGLLTGCGAQPAVDVGEDIDVEDVLLDESSVDETPVESEEEEPTLEADTPPVVETSATNPPAVPATTPPVVVEPVVIPPTVAEPVPVPPVVVEETPVPLPVEEVPPAVVTKAFPWIGETIRKGTPYKIDIESFELTKGDLIEIGETVKVIGENPKAKETYFIIEYNGNFYSINKIHVKEK